MRTLTIIATAAFMSATLSTTAADNPTGNAATGGTMKVISIEATADGGSHFVEHAIPFALQRDDGFGHMLHLTAPFASPGVQFVELPAGLDQDWHNAPARQVVVVLSGELEVETTDGDRRRWKTGDALLPMDVTGKGHRTRCINGPARLVFAPLAQDFNATTWSQD